MPKVIVIGLDGAGFHLLDKWISSGDLSTIGRLLEGGSFQTLRSCYPPVTSPAWRCYSTGVNPGKHGVFWWEEFDREEKTINVPDSRSFNAKDIWDYLGEADFTSAVINMPTTYPPEEINGWMVSMTDKSDGFTAPADIGDELRRTVNYIPQLTSSVAELVEDPGLVEEVNDLIDTRFDATWHLIDQYDPDFCHVTLFITNAIQHFIWDGDEIRQIWEHIDDRIEEFVNEDFNVIIMSDHGSHRIETIFNINRWLETEGYLRSTPSISDRFDRLGLTKETLRSTANQLRLLNFARGLVPETFMNKVPESGGGLNRESKASKIDWENTHVYASGQGPIYVLGDDRNGIKSDLVRKLSTLSDPNGVPIAKNVHTASELYEGPFVAEGPDLVIEQADGVHIPDVVGDDRVFIDVADWKWESENHKNGIFIAFGPDIAANGELPEPLEIYDLAPTILHWYGMDIPNDFDGEVISTIFDDDSRPAKTKVSYSDIDVHERPVRRTDEIDESMVDHLRNLGYFSN